jgi:hypothetical protein
MELDMNSNSPNCVDPLYKVRVVELITPVKNIGDTSGIAPVPNPPQLSTMVELEMAKVILTFTWFSSVPEVITKTISHFSVTLSCIVTKSQKLVAILTVTGVLISQVPIIFRAAERGLLLLEQPLLKRTIPASENRINPTCILFTKSSPYSESNNDVKMNQKDIYESLSSKPPGYRVIRDHSS